MSSENPEKHSEKENRFEGSHFVLESTPSAIVGLKDAVRERLEKKGWTDEQIGQFDLAVDEAAANAVRHGNQEDESKKVTVEINITDERATISFEDEGNGFDFNSVPDPTSEEGIMKSQGRGIFFMKNFADKVTFLGKGNKVVLEKEKHPAAHRGV